MEMTFEITIEKPKAKAIALLVALVAVLLLGLASVSNFIVGVLTDDRVVAPRELLRSAARYFPGSARLNSRLARAEMGEQERDIALAETYARRAANLSPSDYNYQLLLATVQEAKGEREEAERAARRALLLAPNNTNVHWRLANLLLRRGKLAESLKEFRLTTSANPALLPSTLALIWQASGGKVEAVDSVTGSDPKERLTLAQFLLDKSRADDAMSIFVAVDRRARLELSETSAFLSALMASGHTKIARDMWIDTLGHVSTDIPVLWNGGFETDSHASLTQFDWTITSNNYARAQISNDGARTGARALRVDFLGRDTTRLDNEIRQLISTRPGARYRLECFAKSEQLTTPEGPRIVVVDPKAGRVLATSDAVAAGTTDWQRIALEFVCPTDVQVLQVTIRRTPKYSYDDPTRGIVRFDDFALIEQGGNK
jgi:tetratricopeptide (TPR) repeat protein